MRSGLVVAGLRHGERLRRFPASKMLWHLATTSLKVASAVVVAATELSQGLAAPTICRHKKSICLKMKAAGEYQCQSGNRPPPRRRPCWVTQSRRINGRLALEGPPAARACRTQGLQTRSRAIALCGDEPKRIQHFAETPPISKRRLAQPFVESVQVDGL